MPALPQATLWLHSSIYYPKSWPLLAIYGGCLLFPSIRPIMQHHWALVSEKAQALEDIQTICRDQHIPLSNVH
jgi:hypothetical protein